MKRRIFKFAVLLLLGAIANIVMAWSISNAWSDKREVKRVFLDGTTQHLWFPRSLQQGWPMPALLSEVPQADGGSLISTIELSDRIELAIWPIWPGFVVNTVFYAALLWIVLAMPFAMRRRRRLKRGLCPACGYPVGASTICTECGRAIPSSSR